MISCKVCKYHIEKIVFCYRVVQITLNIFCISTFVLTCLENYIKFSTTLESNTFWKKCLEKRIKSVKFPGKRKIVRCDYPVRDVLLQKSFLMQFLSSASSSSMSCALACTALKIKWKIMFLFLSRSFVREVC